MGNASDRPVSTASPLLVGREDEQTALEQRLAAARSGRGGVVVLRGEPGVGKSALIERVVADATGVRVLRCRGVESEVELPFSGLHELLLPLLGGIADLPPGQAAALQSAMAMEAAAPASVVTVSMGTLALLASAAASSPLLVVVDDVHWMDEATLLVLAFVARRVGHDRILMLMAARDDAVSKVVPGERMAVEPLSRTAAHALAAELVGRRLATSTVDAVLRLTAGNPLAVMETLGLSADELDRLEGTLEAPPAPGELIERGFSGRLDALPNATQQALLVVATALSESAELIGAACDELDLPPGALAAAEDAGVLRRRFDHVAFSHPLLRALVFHRATPTEQRASHSALGKVTRERASQAWHAAAASPHADETLASALADAAADFQARGGLFAAAQALEQAARLTPERPQRVRRLIGAGVAARYAGRTSWASSLLEDALQEAGSDARLRLRVESERVPLLAATQSNVDLLARMLGLAREAVELDDEMASDFLAMVVTEGILQGRMELTRSALTELRTRPTPSDPAIAARIPRVEFSALVHSGEDQPRLEQLLAELVPDARTSYHFSNVGFAELLVWLGRDDDAEEIVSRMETAAREAGDLNTLSGTLWVAGQVRFRAGDWGAANVALEQAAQIAEAREIRWSMVCALAMLAFVRASAGTADALQVADQVDHLSAANDYHFVAYTLPARGIYHLAVGEAELAVGALEAAANWHLRAEQREPCALTWPVDIVEAQLLVGDRDAAQRSFDWFRDRVEVTGRRLGAAMVDRLRGMLADDDHYEAHFTAAIAAHAQLRSPFELARTHLHYGKRLRRVGHRTRAQAQLTEAERIFERLGAPGWLVQTRSELKAVGINVDHAPTGDRLLTSQETVVADLVAQGLTNKQVAAQLFLTPKTIEWHLRQIYRKLGIKSRTQLAAHVQRVGASGRPSLGAKQ